MKSEHEMMLKDAIRVSRSLTGDLRLAYHEERTNPDPVTRGNARRMFITRARRLCVQIERKLAGGML